MAIPGGSNRTETGLAVDVDKKRSEVSEAQKALRVLVDSIRAKAEEDSNASSEDDSQDPDERDSTKRQRSKAKRQPHVVSEAKAPKLRPAGDVLQRINWDPALQSADFVIGYMERFEGIKEMPLDLWLRESTEEDFIPQHRIRYFKRVGSGEVVWNRDERIDKIFGSGLGDGVPLQQEVEGTGERADQHAAEEAEAASQSFYSEVGGVRLGY